MQDKYLEHVKIAHLIENFSRTQGTMLSSLSQFMKVKAAHNLWYNLSVNMNAEDFATEEIIALLMGTTAKPLLTKV